MNLLLSIVYSKGLRLYAIKLTGSEYDADDLVQETAIKCIEVGDRYDHLHPNQIRQVVYTTMYRLDISAYRTKRINIVTDSFDTVEAPPMTPAIDSVDMKRIQVLLNKGGKLEGCLKLFLDGYKHTEIAAIMGISEGTAKSNTSRARKKLREEYC